MKRELAEPAVNAKNLNLMALACLVVFATGVGLALFVRGGILHSGPETLQGLILSREPTIWPSVGWSISALGAAGLAGAIIAKIAQGSIGDLLPRRRWFQFSLKTMLMMTTLAGVSLGWWKSYRYCVQRAEEHHTEACIAWLGGHFVDVGDIGEERRKERAKISQSCNKRVEYHSQLKEAYERAAWRPWERLWIDNMPLEDAP